ncbi:Beta-glucosidase A [Poriferisphaera corsica]|uniref:Beta-glucosidase n=1 Tax=Poriferisphaera corsica TaxID=2528020 RepID=A0A517YWI9_9BACT|nr:GH1 family beta-glucosidase [Poriferisphaera corsica]QDU34567.1 Beta-glucosidase A [Poriferisphaera corsica]
MTFPKDFTWGVATSAYQIEGAWDQDGKGQSVWDMACRWPGKVVNMHTGDIACNHYNFYQNDTDIISQIGASAYRFSISWPRVIPNGIGKVNAQGLDFYDKLVDQLLSRNIAPWATLFHWDYPLALFRKGGWLNRDSADWFAEYTQVIVDKLSDRVSHWMTLNEPQCFIGSGHYLGSDAPCLKLPLSEGLLACHNALRSHGKSVQVIRNSAKNKPFIGWAPVGVIKYPLCEEPKHIEAARALTMSGVFKENPFWTNTWYSDPVILGQYPEDGMQAYCQHMDWYDPCDMAEINQPIDFYGVNIYNGQAITLDENDTPKLLDQPQGAPRTAFNWDITPPALRWGVKFLHDRYGLPMYVTENGMSSHDWIDCEGKVQDTQRIDYLRRYLLELKKAVADGADVRGYFQWSLLDNFEWTYGYTQRFGLVHVDYETQKRTLKQSAYWYRDVIQKNDID